MSQGRKRHIPKTRLGEWLNGVALAAFGPKIPLHRGENFAPFFLVGSPRSGTTLVRRILEAGEEVHIPPETQVLRTLIPQCRQFRQMPWPMMVTYMYGRLEYHARFGEFGVSLRDLAREVKRTPPERQSLALILDAFYRFHAASVGKSCARWGDKTPLNCFCMHELRAVFPDARFVHIVRDGVDSAQSYVQAGLADTLDEAARRWRRSVTAVGQFAAKHPEVVHEVRYERLVTEPEETSRRLCEFLGLKFRPEMVERTDHAEKMADVAKWDFHANVRKPVTADSIGKGRRQLTAEQRAGLQPILGQELARLGYAPATEAP